MMLQALVVKAASTVVTGAVGVAAYEGVKKIARRTPVRQAAVTVTAWGLRGVRKAEEGAKSARLAVSDVVAEAKEHIGEEASLPTEPGHGHTH
ncbi:DUF1490 family protein (plasmid) [Rhodococcus sp. ZPP]|uniref:DUF1490 family protein n=1 Tax=Rhodococcus sp. ZPP TaxID=2749906 RepID=UPI001AD8713B|nr:DUF1490 family protein [Rhodococcus sp. ZPP]QTJ70808.1 DUF1490 family protein [Rhodococcus sp. ZPP]